MELGRRRVAPLLADFAARHSGLEVHLMLSDARLAIGQDGIDVALRIDLPDDPGSGARREKVTSGAPIETGGNYNGRG